MGGPLAGYRVLDFTTTFSGPYCTQLLADLGAEVVKVESKEGDITRQLGNTKVDGVGSVFAGINRDKASRVADLKTSEGRATVAALLPVTDCVVHNMRPSAASRLGIDPESVWRTNPHVVHAVITGFGTEGPRSGDPAYDDIIQAACGLASLQGGSAGPPAYVASAVADKITGLAAAGAVLAALLHRERTGETQAVEIPMFETMVAFTFTEMWGGRAFVPSAGGTGYARLRSPHRRPYATTDGVIAVVVYHGGHWQRFLEFIGRSDLLASPRFATVRARAENVDALYEMLETALATRSTDEWLAIFRELDIPAGRVADLDTLLEDEHLAAVDFFQEVTNDDGDRFLAARSPLRFSRTPLPAPRSRPGPQRLGRPAQL